MVRHTLGILADQETDEVPGTILLLPKSKTQQPLGIDPETTSIKPSGPELKRTPCGNIILDPQPDEHPDDPLNWAQWRRDVALLVLGWHCLVGGGQTPVLAAGFGDVSSEFNVGFAEVALTTGLFMMGMGVGSLLWSPTAIIFGKRPVYLVGTILFLISSIWAAAAKSYVSLLIARIVMGIGIAPCEALPSATIAEIFFLHERAYRVGIYTLLLLGGKNLVPLVSAVVIQAMGWRWVFWIVAIIVGCNFFLLFVFVPETFWDRTTRPAQTIPGLIRRASSIISGRSRRTSRSRRSLALGQDGTFTEATTRRPSLEDIPDSEEIQITEERLNERLNEKKDADDKRVMFQTDGTSNSSDTVVQGTISNFPNLTPSGTADPEKSLPGESSSITPKPWIASLKPYNGILRHESWFKAFIRPLILFAYPAILWSTVVYSLSVGWLIVLSECVAHIYQHQPYNFNRLQTGLVYLSPFIGGILGTAVAGKASDIIVRFMSRRNNGIYEPEFRLVMGLPIALATAAGLMGFGWSAEEKNNFWVPTIFFGIISFGCTLGSTTAITYAVDSYRQYAGEALVTLNFSKNVFHGMVFSFFFNNWLEADGSKQVFIILGVIQLVCLAFTVPLYIYGKRARMWTVRKDLMRRFT